MWSVLSAVVALLCLVVAALIVFGWARRERLTFRGKPILAGGRRVVLGLVLLALLAAFVVIQLRPQYEVHFALRQQVVAGQNATISLEVKNTGTWSGHFAGDCYVDGVTWKKVAFLVKSKERIAVDVPLPSDLSPGNHVLQMQGGQITVHFLRPAAFEVASLNAASTVVKSGAKVRVVADIKNTGEVSGSYQAALRVDGKIVSRQEVFVSAGSTAEAAFQPKLAGERQHEITLENSSATVRSVHTARYATGYVMRWYMGRGRGVLKIDNGGSDDALVLLTRSIKKPSAVAAIFVRAHSTAVVSAIPDGGYYFYFSLGRDWSPTLKRFLAVERRQRFADIAEFTTSWSTYRVIWSVWSIGLTPAGPGSGKTGTLYDVDPRDFPSLDQGSSSPSV
jgi:hypothetical protein